MICIYKVELDISRLRLVNNIYIIVVLCVYFVFFKWSFVVFCFFFIGYLDIRIGVYVVRDIL